MAENINYFREKNKLFVPLLIREVFNKAFLVSKKIISEKLKPTLERKPLRTYKNVAFSENNNIYPKPFASKEETNGLLSGSEGWTLCSKEEPIYSYGFVQCSAALIRNRDTGLISLIHQSTWSEAADAALMLQRREDLDVITISGPFGLMKYESIEYAHEKDPSESADNLSRIDLNRSRKYRPKGENKTHVMAWSGLVGLTEEEVQKMIADVLNTDKVGLTRHVGDIDIPLEKNETDRWSLLYRPKENIIWIFEKKSKNLFKYKGFDLNS